ncbi:MAG: DNA repair protein RecO [Clostridia bacterium]|nr:DNA repair protein RecO [Clostridia bacterium]
MPTKKAPSDLVASLCLVLRVTQYGEADSILTLFSRSEGLLSARAYGVKSLKSSFRAACQPFCVAEFEFYRRGDRLSVKAASVKSQFAGLQDDYTAYVCGCIILELTEKVLVYAEEYEEIFRLTVSAVAALSSEALPPKSILLFFLIRLTYYLGVFPVVTSCASCGAAVPCPQFWSSAEGGVICENCARTQPSAPANLPVLRCLRSFGRGQLRDLTAHSTEEGTADASCRLLMEYLRAQYGLHLRTAAMLPRSRTT